MKPQINAFLKAKDLKKINNLSWQPQCNFICTVSSLLRVSIKILSTEEEGVLDMFAFWWFEIELFYEAFQSNNWVENTISGFFLMSSFDSLIKWGGSRAKMNNRNEE